MEIGAESVTLQIPAGEVTLTGDLEIPENARGLVLFAHGSGSSRRSPRNQAVAEVLRDAGMATLLFDLLTPHEEAEDAYSGHLRFDIGLLSRRLAIVTEEIADDPHSGNLGLGYFGASTGGAAALRAAAALGSTVGAVVSRGGRPDLAGEALAYVKAPTLLIVGERDEDVLRLNEHAYAQLQCEKSLAVVPHATHLFQEPGTLEEVARLAADWFRKHLEAAKMRTQFRDRTEAGELLAEQLTSYANKPNVIVLALPRGGVPVGAQVARKLNVPLDVFVVRKLGLPGHPELAMGAIATGGVRVLNGDVINSLRVPDEVINAVTAEEYQELQRRERSYRDDLPPPEVEGKTVIIVDDGIATGSTMFAAIAALRQLNASRIVVATPTIARSTYDYLRKHADEVVAVIVPEEFYGVGQWYEDFSQTTDEEVHELLGVTNHRAAPAVSMSALSRRGE